jgi:hypothetical protein
MEANYWTRFTRTRLSRRRALAATGGAAAAAAFLAACGGDDDDGGSGSAESDLLIKPTEQTGSRKRGGTLNIAANVANATLEQALAGNGSGTPLSQSVYSQLMRMKMGIYPEIPEQNP